MKEWEELEEVCRGYTPWNWFSLFANTFSLLAFGNGEKEIEFYFSYIYIYFFPFYFLAICTFDVWGIPHKSKE